MLTPPIDYDTDLLRASMKGIGTDEDLLVRAGCCGTSALAR
jgi:hypothetical protein